MNEDSSKTDAGLHVAMVSVHGLIRGHDLELGRDADTGGQTKYVVELAKAVGARKEVARVDLFTRLVASDEVDADYGRPVEELAPGVRIVRVEAGPPDEYLAKERLWPHLDAFADGILAFFRREELRPDLVHGHYADAGFVACRLVGVLGVPMLQTGHSLGRIKRRRLLASGLGSEEIEERYNISQRIEAEELGLANADAVIASTAQEKTEQYELYDYHDTERIHVLPPGTDLEKFHPPGGDEWNTAIGQEIRRFLRTPERPLVLALSRPDQRKNLATLVEAFGRDEELRSRANLAIIAGNRDDVDELERGAREVLTELLIAIDRHDLYGRVAYPKHHGSEEVPIIYRLAAHTRGVFVNPALTEPFGLTLIEAAASGLPIVATNDGGPRDIVSACENGLLVDPLDPDAMAEAIRAVLANEENWRKLAEGGLAGARRHYSWEAHAAGYLRIVEELLDRVELPERLARVPRPHLQHDRALFTDIDHALIGDASALRELLEELRRHRRHVLFGIATSRRLDAAVQTLRRHGVPEPDVLVTSNGTAIHYGKELIGDEWWDHHIEHMWTPGPLARVLAGIPGLTQRDRAHRSRFRLSYDYDPERAPPLDEILQILFREELSVHPMLTGGRVLDVLPVRASKGLALRHVMHTRGIPIRHVLAAGGSFADEDMIRGNTLGVVVRNRFEEELAPLEGGDRVHFAEGAHAAGILEGIRHYDFFGTCRAPGESEEQGA